MTDRPGNALLGALHNAIYQMIDATDTINRTADSLPSPAPVEVTTQPEAAWFAFNFSRALAEQAKLAKEAAARLEEEARERMGLFASYESQLHSLFD